MRKKYSLQTVQDDDDNFFHCVFEEQTQQAIGFYYFLDDAKEVSAFMESGGAFDGFTPAFMLIEPTVDRDTNSKFVDYLKE